MSLISDQLFQRLRKGGKSANILSNGLAQAFEDLKGDEVEGLRKAFSSFGIKVSGIKVGTRKKKCSQR